MRDIAIIHLPGTISRIPPAAPALLKASILQHGFTCTTVDFNIKLYHSGLPNITELETYFTSGLNTEVHDQAVALINTYVDEVINLDPRFVGISVFTYQNRIATKLFCEELRKRSSIKIILGGQGLTDGGILGSQGFAKDLQNQGIIDYYIKSEGERSLVELLKSNFEAPGINSDSFDQIKNLDDYPIPDYSDYNLSLYDNVLPITASRGCVRACTFCDIHDHWAYRFRSGEVVANEIITLYNRYKVTHFSFTDSLINGSLREFKIFCKRLAEFNLTTGANITYRGQYIVRSSGQLDESYWENLANSGAGFLSIGVETGSDRVRLHMNKKFTNADLDYTMEQLDKYNITCAFLMIFGYPTETEQDFQDTLDLFKRYQYLANRIIKYIEFGSTLSILPGTPLYNNAKEYNIELDKHENNWVALDNVELTLAERIRRRNTARQYVIDLGYELSNDLFVHMLQILETNLDHFEKRNQVKRCESSGYGLQCPHREGLAN